MRPKIAIYVICLLCGVVAFSANSQPNAAYDSTRSEVQTGLHYLDLGKYTLAAKHFNRAAYFFDHSERQSSLLWAVLHRYQGDAYYRLGAVSRAIECFERSHSYLLRCEETDSDLLQYVLSMLGELHALHRNYQTAQQYLEEQLSIVRSLRSLHTVRPYAMMNLANILYHKGDLDQAMQLYRAARRALLANQPDDLHGLADLYDNIAAAYRRKNEIDSSLYYLYLELNIRQHLDAEHLLAKLYSDLGASHHLAGDDPLAESFFLRGIKLASETPCPLNLYVHLYMKYVQFLRDQNRLKESLSQLKKARYLSLVDTEDGILAADPVSHILMLAEEASIRTDIFEQCRDSAEITRAFQRLYEAVDQIKEYQMFATERQLHRRQTDIFYPVFEQLLHLISTYPQYSPQSGEELSETVFEIMEYSKNIRLLESLNARQAEHLAGVPDSLISRSRKWLDEIQTIKNQLVEAREQEQQAAALRSSLYRKETRYRAFLRRMYNRYPRYFHLIHCGTTLDLNQFQDHFLEEDDLFIEYFIGEEHSFALAVDKQSARVHTLSSPDSLRTLVYQFDSLLQVFPQLNSRRKQHNTYRSRLSHIAVVLYQHCLFPISIDEYDRLIIVLDDALHLLPFESLMTTLPASGSPYCQWPFLIKQHDIAYQFSATLWREMRENTSPTTLRNILFSCDFKDELHIKARGLPDSFVLAALPNSSTEIKALNTLLNGKLIEGPEATKQNFLKSLPGSGIIHISTHTVINDQFPEQSFLSVYPEHANGPACLYLSDLLNVYLPAQLVTLNSCSSFRGPYRPGLGMASISKGFAFAGARSLIATRWPVADRNRHPVIGKTYSLMLKKYDKVEALSEAKRYAISQCDPRYGHPIYWSNYLLIGNTDPLSDSSGWPLYVIWILIGLVVIIGGRKIFQRIKKTGRSTSETTSYNKL